jgi:hypothetical protein
MKRNVSPEHMLARLGVEQLPPAANRNEAERSERGAPPPGGGEDRPKPNFRTLAKFCAEFRPISYAVAGLMREGSPSVATGEGEKLIGRKVKKGRVAFATAENPDDLRMRFMVACFVFKIDLAILGGDLLVSDNRVAPEEIVAWIRQTGQTFDLIVVDTWQAFFDGRDPNNNAEAVSFTRRFRPLAAAKGQPVVIVAAHPPKQAKDDNLLPCGGGGTLNEVDGNFTTSRDGNGLFRFHWLGKIRGLPFDPLYFRIERLGSPDVVTDEAVEVQMPVMFSIDEEAVEARSDAFAQRELTVLKAIAADPAGSERKWALATGMNRRAIQGALRAMKAERLVTQNLRRWRLTKEGERIAQEGEPAPENDRANGGPAERETGRAKKRAKEDHATAVDPNIH